VKAKLERRVREGTGGPAVAEILFEKSVYRLDDLPRNGLPEICISGRSNVGKSSLLNRLAKRRNLAKISGKPGKTRSLNFFIVDSAYYMVDLPGYGYAKVPKSERGFFAELVNPYLASRRELVGIVQLMDARHGPVSGDRDMLDWLAHHWDGAVLYVFTKADKLSANGRAKVLSDFTSEYGEKEQVFFSAVNGAGLDRIRSWIRRICPAAR